MAPEEEIKLEQSKPKISGSLPVSDYIEGMMAKYAIKALWILVGAALAFLLTQFFGLSTIVHEINGKQQQTDETINMLLDERDQTFSTLLELQQQLTEENKRLREQIDNPKN